MISASKDLYGLPGWTAPSRGLQTEGWEMESDELATHRWSLTLRGVAAILFGALILMLPDVTPDALILLFGSYVLFEGLCIVAAAVRDRSEHRSWGAALLRGLLSIVTGIIAFALPGPTDLALFGVIGVWAIVSGISETIAGMRLHRRFRARTQLVANGALSIAFGTLTILMPEAGALSLVRVTGAYATALGGLVLGAA